MLVYINHVTILLNHYDVMLNIIVLEIISTSGPTGEHIPNNSSFPKQLQSLLFRKSRSVTAYGPSEFSLLLW